MRYVIIGLAIAIVIVVIYLVVKSKASSNKEPAYKSATDQDGTLQAVTGAGAGSNIAGNQLAPVLVSIGTNKSIEKMVLCQNKCRVLHPFNKSKRTSCMNRC